MIRTHTLRLSNAERAQKTKALYSFITSEQCAQHFASLGRHAGDLTEPDVKEVKAHKATWKRRGELIAALQKDRADICVAIDRIIGTGPDAEGQP